MRDALSLLDQAIAYAGGRVREAEVRAMLGTLEQAYVLELLRALAAADGAALLEAVERLSQRTPDYEGVLAELLTCLQQIAIAQAVPAALDEQLEEREALLELAQQLPAEDVQLYYQIGLIGRRDLQLAPDLRGGLEMVLLRMLAFRPDSEKRSAGVTGPARCRDAGPRQAAREEAGMAPEPTPPAAAPAPEGNWAGLIGSMKLKGVLRELAVNCAIGRTDGDRWHLLLDPGHQQLLSKERQQRLEQQLRQRLQRDVRLEIEVEGGAEATPAQQARQEADMRQAAAIHAIESDPNIKAIQQAFDATLHPESIRPVESQ
jgi:DNA polymerase-3 subunit gamma/tau